MIRTFNRNPISVPTPSKNDIKDYFFTQNNFKGLSNSKNFLTDDPDTFSDCDNVFVDSEGLLKSRPGINNKEVIVTISNNETVLEEILNVHTFGDVTVYRTNDKLIFVDPAVKNATQLKVTTEYKLILVEKVIYIFTPTNLQKYKIGNANGVYSATSDIYKPVTKLVVNGTETDLESPNELTTSHIVKYLFDNITENNFDILLGKNLNVKINDTTYTILFEKNKEYVLIETFRQPNSNKSGKLHVSNSNASIYTDDSNNIIWYTTNGITYKTIDKIKDCVGDYTLSDDGRYICCVGLYDVYAYDTSNVDADEWESCLRSLDNEFYMNEFTTRSLRFSYDTGIKMLTKDTYVVIATDTLYKRVCIVCNSGTFKLYEIFDTSTYDTLKIQSGWKNESSSIILDTVDTPKVISFFNKAVYFYDIMGTTSTVDIRCLYNLNVSYDIIDGKVTVLKLTGNVKILRRGASNFVEDKYTKNILVDYDMLQCNSVYLCGLDISFELNGLTLTINITNDGKNVKNDINYPNGLSYNDQIDNDITLNAQLSMQVIGEDFLVVGNVGEIFTIDKNCIDRVNYITRPWRYKFDPVNFGLSICDDYLYYVYNLTDGSNIVYNISKLQNSKYTTIKNVTYPYYSHTVLGKSGSLLTKKHYRRITNDDRVGTDTSLLKEATPVAVTDDVIYNVVTSSSYNTFYKTIREGTLEFEETVNVSNSYIVPDYVTELDNYYISKGEKLYISSYPSEGVFKWYFPTINTEVFDYNISNLKTLSSEGILVFLKDAVYTITKSEQGYLYNKTKIDLGLRNGSDIITSYDSKYTIYASDRGLVALTYQDFVATTDQVLVFLSDTIYDTFKSFNTGAIKLFKYDFWIICYKENNNKYLVLDIRNNSWWPMTLTYNIQKFVTINDKPHVVCNNKLYEFSNIGKEYYDDEITNVIDWYFVSRQLHLNAPNYYKHISNITFTSVLDVDEDMYLDLVLYNYRKTMAKSKVESFKFKIDIIRTYVKQLNYAKVNEFQYMLTSSLDDAASYDALEVPRVPLSLSSIVIKYRISGQVR